MAVQSSDGACSSPHVTVLIAAFNAGRFITRAIDSALAQAGVDLEVLVVDDGSTDDTAAVAVRGGDPRIRVLSLEANVGPSAARNAGLENARAAWVAILDADDAYEPGRLSRLLEVAEAQAADIVADNFSFYDAGSEMVGEAALASSPDPERLTAVSFVERARPYSAEADYGLLKPVFRRDFLIRHKLSYPESIRHGEDFLLILDALQAGAKYVLVRTPGYLYTLRNSGRSRTSINYDKQEAITRDLAQSARSKGDAGLTAALLSRADALARLSVERPIEDAGAARNPVAIGSVVLRYSRGWAALVRRARLAVSG
jgi:succinoglycan biosynthesis protein ExoO